MKAVPSKGDEFNSRALLQRSRDALFVLNHQRRLRFANAAWEKLTGKSLEDHYGLNCAQRAADPLARALFPPPEVLTGSVARARRPAPPARVGPPWWDLVFLPLAGSDGQFAIIGRITVIGSEAPAKGRALPEGVMQLRQQLPEQFRFDLLDSESPNMRRVSDQARLASQVRAPLTVIGEVGVGKRWLARIVHHQGVAAEQGFVGVDCAALPAPALAALLTRGRATQGTIYLREPALLPRDLQVTLTDGLNDSSAIGARLIAGFRTDPARNVAEGRLHQELAMALGVLTIDVPPLRERRQDIPRLASAALDRALAAGVPKSPGFQPDALQLFSEYSWPGNLRELDLAVTSSALLAKGQLIAPEHLPLPIVREASRKDAVARSPGNTASPVTPIDALMEQVERRLITQALRRARGVKAEAARLLDMPYNRLVRRVRDLKISAELADNGDGNETASDEASADRDL